MLYYYSSFQIGNSLVVKAQKIIFLYKLFQDKIDIKKEKNAYFAFHRAQDMCYWQNYQLHLELPFD